MAFSSFIIYISVAVIVSFVAGVIMSIRLMHRFADGAVVIDHSTEEPIPFMEVPDNSGDILNTKRYIVLSVEHRNYLPDAK